MPARLLVVLLVLLPCPALAADSAEGLKLPPGFAAVEVAGPGLANDIHCMTLDDAGRVVVSGRGYIRVLADDDGDGRADRAIDLTDRMKDGAMGLLCEGNSLYAVGDGGLWRFPGYDG